MAFLVAFAVYFLKRYLPNENVSTYFILSITMSSLVFAWDIYRRGWNRETVLAIIAAVAYVIILPVHYYTRDSISTFSVLSFFFLSVAVDQEDRHLVQVVFYTKLLLGIAVLTLFDLGIFQDFLTYRSGEVEEKVRHSFGFGHPNSLGMYMVVLLMDYFLMMRKEKVSFLAYLMGFGFSLLIFAASDSKLSLMVGLLVLGISLLKQRLNRIVIKGQLLFSGIMIAYLLGILLSFSYQENIPFFTSLNALFTGRLKYAHQYMVTYGLHLFSNDYPSLYSYGVMLANENFYVDSLLRNGLVLYLFYPFMMWLQIERKQFSLYYVCLTMLCFFLAMVEDYGASVLMMTPLLFNYFGRDQDEVSLVSDSTPLWQKVKHFFDRRGQ
ncbi:hypothetical protein [Streptococcus saliviloxodontae]|uniref:hypothetical protein n=1 Tax=Streptococcus saliviloxodontae TaxID=1349416 RepID=UPI00195F49EA|nr:hypothetical protein [Streptococcus saliviloxodontae]